MTNPTTQQPVTLIKLGGSVITEKNQPDCARIDVIKQLVKTIAEVSQKTNQLLIIGHGQGGFAHFPAKKYNLPSSPLNPIQIKTRDQKKLNRGLIETRKSVTKLHRVIMQEMLEVGMAATSLRLSRYLTTRNYKPTSDQLPILKSMFLAKQTPITTGDVMEDELTTCMVWSTEQIFSFLINYLTTIGYTINKQIMVTDVVGLLDTKNQLVEKITPDEFKEQKNYIFETAEHDVTGGMLHKIESALNIAREKAIETDILSGLDNQQLRNNLLGKEWIGTKVLAS